MSRRMMKRAGILVATLGIGACGGQTGDITPPCGGPEQYFAMDAPTPMGLSGESALASLAPQTTATLAWQNGGSSEFTFSVTAQTGGMVLFRAEEPLCPASIEVPVVVGASTTDGQLAETTDGWMRMTEASVGKLFADIYFDVLQGTVDLTGYYDVNAIEPPNLLLFDGDLTATGSGGQLWLQTPKDANGGEDIRTVAIW